MMHTHKNRVGLLLAILFFSACVTVSVLWLTKLPVKAIALATAKDETIPSGPEAFTRRNWNAVRMAHFQRTLVEAYVNVGVHDPVWDAKARAFLLAYAEHLCEQPVAATKEALAASGKELEDLQCTDPMVRCVYGLVLSLNERHKEAVAVLSGVANSLHASRYPACRKMQHVVEYEQALLDVKSSMMKEFDHYLGVSVKLTADSLHDDSYLKGEERIMLRDLSRAFSGIMFSKRFDIIDMLKNDPAIDQYIPKTLEGSIEIEKAWNARSGGLARDVTPEQWKGFEEHLSKARELLTGAWQLRPDCPEAPAQMIKVAMGGHAGKGETPRLWFNRAVAAQMDYQPAYDALRVALLPRWRGSLEQLHAFAIECLNTQRFDTGVPENFLTLLLTISGDTGGDKSVWTRKETYPRLAALYDGYAATEYRNTKEWYLSMKAACAWHCEQFDEAKACLDALGEKADPQAFARLSSRVPFPMARSEVYAKAGEGDEQLRQAESLASRGETEQALAIYQRVRNAQQEGAVSLPYLSARTDALQDVVQFEKGEWVSLHPREDFFGWRKVGEWTIEPDGAISPDSQKGRQLLICMTDFGNRIEFRGEIVFDDSRSLMNGAAIFNYTMAFPANYFSFSIEKRSRQAFLQNRISTPISTTAKRIEVLDTNQFCIRQWDRTVHAYLNGNLVDQKTFSDIVLHGRSFVGVGRENMSGNVVRFRNLQIRKLSQKPADPPENVLQ